MNVGWKKQSHQLEKQLFVKLKHKVISVHNIVC